MPRRLCPRRYAQTLVRKRSEPERNNMTPQEIDELSIRIAKKMNLVATHRLKELVNQATITSGFSREVLRLNQRDVEFLAACGVKVE